MCTHYRQASGSCGQKYPLSGADSLCNGNKQIDRLSDRLPGVGQLSPHGTVLSMAHVTKFISDISTETAAFDDSHRYRQRYSIRTIISRSEN